MLLADKGANLNTLFYYKMSYDHKFEPLVFDLVSDYEYQDKKQKPKQLELLRFLLEIGADPNIKNIEGMNLLHYAVDTDSSFAQVVIESGKIKDINERVDKYRTDMYHDETALHIAVFDKQLSTVKALINAGADVNAINKWGKTPLEMSESQSISKIIQKAGGKTLVELLESEEKAKNCKNSIWEESEKIGKNKRKNEIIFQQNAIYYDTIHNEPLWKIFIEVSDEYLEKLSPIYYLYTKKDLEKLKSGDKYKPNKRDELKALVKDESINLKDIDISLITDMSFVFSDSERKDFSGIEDWDMSKVTNTNYMFYNAKNFNHPLNKWDMSNVSSMKGMFYEAQSFNQPLDKWDTSNVINMSEMFDKAKKFNQPLENWNVSNVRNMYGMFYRAQSFNQPLDKWDIKSVENMKFMFSYAKSFNQNLDTWDLSKVKNKEFIADRKKVKLNIPIPTKQSSANEKLLKAILRSNVDNFHKAIKAGANINEPIEVIEDYDDCEEYEGCSFLAVALDKALYHLTYFNHGKRGKFNKEKYEKNMQKLLRF